MKVEKTLNRLARSPESQTELRRAGRALANELPRQRAEVLRDFRTRVSALDVPEGSFAAGYLASMRDITAEYEVYLRALDDQQHVAQTALREDWREVLGILADGARLPSDIATRLGRDRPSVTRMLKRMRSAGLVESFAADSLDGRMRPQRLTLQGRRLLDQLQKHAPSGPLSPDMARGIGLAVSLFQRLASRPTSTLAELDAVVAEEVEDESLARKVVELWTQESRRLGMMPAAGAHVEARDPSGPDESAAAPTEAGENPLWQRIPAILSALDAYRDADTAIYVRTDDSAWGAWAYALQQDDASDGSRTIVRGDILTRSLTPPDRRFSLVYDNPEAIGADLEEPAMRAFLEQAHNKFVIASHGDRVPDGFIPLSADEVPDGETTGRELPAHGPDDDE